jgi:hypothetical protein
MIGLRRFGRLGRGLTKGRRWKDRLFGYQEMVNEDDGIRQYRKWRTCHWQVRRSEPEAQGEV